MSDFVLTERTGAIVTLTLNRPEQRNAISAAEPRPHGCVRHPHRGRQVVHVPLDTLPAMSAAFGALAHHTEDHQRSRGSLPRKAQTPLYRAIRLAAP